MSSIDRALTGPVMTFKLEDELRTVRGEDAYRQHGRAARTLTKTGRMRVALVAMARDSFIGTHQADSPLTLQVLEGHIHFRAADGEHDLRPGELLFFGPSDAHDIRAVEESALLLTLSAIGDDDLAQRPDEDPAPR